jgi:hypothetical protein
MKNPLFVGRETELERFRQLRKKETASLIVCQGRRRIGKSTFFRQCAKEIDHFLNFEGLAPRPKIGKTDQLEAFANGLAAQTKIPKVSLVSWTQAFQLLYASLPASGSVLILLDEISWMAIDDVDFPGHLKIAWDGSFSQRPGLILALCGSVSSWIQENILNNTGFVGRCSWSLHLPPLSLPACNKFWEGKSISTTEKLKVLAVTGGVPRYLEEIDPTQTAEQNIERLCFDAGGLLFNEFDQIFQDIFSRRAATYREILLALIDSAKSVTETSKALGHQKSGVLSKALVNLEAAGFVTKAVSFDPETAETRDRTIKYRILDNYLRFYLKYVEPAREQIRKGLYQRTPLETLQAWDTIAGLQFENLILCNQRLVLDKIGLGNVPVLNVGPYFQATTIRHPGCQIDLLIRTEGSLYVFELKFRKSVGKGVIKEVQQKIARLGAGPTLSVRKGLIFQGELDPEIKTADFFDYIVPFETLLS